MRAGCLLSLSITAATQAGIQPSFYLSRLAREATDILELAPVDGKAAFRIVATLRGATPSGRIREFPELAPSQPGEHRLLRELVAPDCAWLEPSACYTAVPTVRPLDRQCKARPSGSRTALRTRSSRP